MPKRGWAESGGVTLVAGGPEGLTSAFVRVIRGGTATVAALVGAPTVVEAATLARTAARTQQAVFNLEIMR